MYNYKESVLDVSIKKILTERYSDKKIKDFIKYAKPETKEDYIKEARIIHTAELYKIAKQEKLKHRYKYKGKTLLYIGNDIRLSINYAIWKELYNKCGYTNNFDNVIRSLTACSELSDNVRKAGPDCGKDINEWTMISGLNNLYGKRPNIVDSGVIREKVRLWVNNNYKPTYNGSSDIFLYLLREEVYKILTYRDGTINTGETIDNYLNNLQATSTQGSGYDPEGGPNLEVKVKKNGTKLKYKKSKFTKSAGLSFDQKKKKMENIEPSRCRVSLKMWESWPKLRLIISSDYKTHLKMTYLRRWFKKWMGDNNNSTVWMKKKYRFDMWKRFSNLENEVAVPIDQTLFDHHASKDVVIAILETIQKVITERESNYDVRNDHILNIDRLIESMKKTKIIYDDTNLQVTEGSKTKKYEEINWESGILSGWSMTSEINTLYNIAQKNIALRWMEENNITYECTLFNAQGDDQLVRFRTWAQCLGYYMGMSQSGAEIHLSKNFFSDKHDEYLRKVGYKKNINGYLPRAIDALMWEPNLMKLTKQQKLSESASIWKRISDRCHKTYDFIKGYFIDDCVGGKISNSDVSSYWVTPRTYGGFGMGTGSIGINGGVVGKNNVWKKFEAKPKEIRVGLEFIGSGLKQFSMRLDKQVRDIEKWAINCLNPEPRSGDIYIYSDNTEFEKVVGTKDKAFLITDNIQIKKPDYNEGWSGELIFSSSDIVLEEAYKNYTGWRARFRCSKKWLADFVLGRVKAPTPIIDGMSDDFVSMLCSKWKNSLYLAMMKKKERSVDDWYQLALFYEKHIYEKLDAMWHSYSMRG